MSSIADKTEPAEPRKVTRPAHPMYRMHVGGTSSHMTQAGRLIVRHSYPGGVERSDEYDMKTGQLLVRKWRSKGALGAPSPWEFEIGEAATSMADTAAATPELSMRESSSAPVVSKKDTARAWEFRIRNLPYPIETYLLSVEVETNSIVLRTTNKKYFKKLDIPAMWRAGKLLDESSLSMEHNVNTLIIRYAKPDDVAAMELEEKKSIMEAAKHSGDVGCKTQ